MKLINKMIFLNAQNCLTWGWHLRSNSDAFIPTKSEEFRINEGLEIGKMARSLFQSGILVNEGSNLRNHEKTKQLLSDQSVSVIFEATFIVNDMIAKADILIRSGDCWYLIEVKSSAASDKLKEDLIDDLAYTAFIIESSKIKLTKMGLMLVSKSYRLGMSNRQFFEEIDCTTEVTNRLPTYEEQSIEISSKTSMKEMPIPELTFICKKCDLYKTDCLGKNITNPIFDLPRISETKFKKLLENDFLTIEKIPIDFDLTSTQQIVREVVQSQKSWIDIKTLSIDLGEIIFPAYYLDFESVSTAIPLYPDIGPYEEIVTQYSIHMLNEITGDIKHYEFLANEKIDDRRNIAEKLIDDLGSAGSIIVYHAQAEKRFINSLANKFPDLAVNLSNIINRIVDLEIILRNCYYHPSFHGSYSIKVVLPVLMPEMNYKNLAIGDGLSASVAFAEIARGKHLDNETNIIRDDLLKYCKQDTLAMVKIHKKLLSLTEL